MPVNYLWQVWASLAFPLAKKVTVHFLCKNARKKAHTCSDCLWKCEYIVCGVPQDWILGPILFILYVYDITCTSDIVDFILFADDRENVRANVGSNDTGVVDESNMHEVFFYMHDFDSLTTSNIDMIIMNFSSKTCSLDTIPTWLAKDNLRTLLPTKTEVVYCHLESPWTLSSNQ